MDYFCYGCEDWHEGRCPKGFLKPADDPWLKEKEVNPPNTEGDADAAEGSGDEEIGV